MGILEEQLSSVFGEEVVISPYSGEDFPGGFIVTEIINGEEREENRLVFNGKFMPHVPFEIGAEQTLTKEYYAGHSEPTVQVMGPREAPLTVKGRLRSKNLNTDQYNLAEKYREAMLDICRRGNLLKLELGEWYRYGFLENCTFPMKSRSDMEYTLTFFIVGEKAPSFNITSEADDDVGDPAVKLGGLSAELQATTLEQTYKLKLSVFDTINREVNKVATLVASVTNFVDGALADVDNLVYSAKRAIGLITYARKYMSKTARRINDLANDVASLPSTAVQEHEKAIAAVANSVYAIIVRENYIEQRRELASLQRRFEAITYSVPYRRHLVKVGDTLQKISIRYYNDAGYWDKIKQHNNLTDTALVIGSILEIPKL